MYSMYSFFEKRLPLILITIMIFFKIYLFYPLNRYYYDEMITIKTVQRMLQTGDLDTNWKKSGFAEFGNQYSFSSYIYCCFVISYIYFKVFNNIVPSEFNIHLILKFLNIIFFVSTILLLIKIPVPSISIRAILFFVIPILFQDNFYVRPESFMTLLITLIIFLLFKIKHNKSYITCCAIYFLIGQLASSKITYILLVIMPIIYLLVNRKGEKHDILFIILICFLFTVLGFFIGSPYAFFNLDLFLEGIFKQKQIYSSEFPPHSKLYLKHSFVNLIWHGEYFYQIFGLPLVSIFGVGCLVLWKKDKADLIIYFLPFILFLALFSFQNCFMERNFSPLIPIVIIIISIGLNYIKSKVNPFLFYIIIILAFIKPIYISYEISREIKGYYTINLNNYENDLLRRFNMKQLYSIEYEAITDLSGINKLKSLLSESFIDTTIIKHVDYNDDYTQRFINFLPKEYIKIAENKSVFHNMVTSTLHTYHFPSFVYYIRSKQAGKGDTNRP